jgi:FkbM family methyltransferase
VSGAPACDGRNSLEITDITPAHVALQLFPGYSDADTAIFEEFRNPAVKPEPGFVVDFLGSRIRVTSLWNAARALDGRVLGIPVPADFHAEAIEWIGLLKAARGAKSQYVAMELGAGFGPWSVAGGRAARLRGINNIRLYAVEGDPHHFRYLRQHFIDNAFDPDRHVLLEAAVGSAAGVAEWPVVDDSYASEEWGLRPVMAGSDYMGRQFQNMRKVDVIPMRELVGREPLWDLIHIDVQGSEVEICRSCIDELSARVCWIIAGTHSRKIDGDLLELMCRAGWILEHEKPAKFSFSPNPLTLEAMTTVDGTQVWRNPRLAMSGSSLTSFSHSITASVPKLDVRAGGVFNVTITVKNTGAEPWFSGAHPAPVNASYRWLDGQGNDLLIEGNRSSLEPPVLRSGENISLTLKVNAPPNPGSYQLLISMVQEGISWFYNRGATPLILPVKAT